MYEINELLVKLEQSKDDEEYYKNYLEFAKSTALQIKNHSNQDSWISQQVQRKYNSYTYDEIEEFLANPRSNEKQLRELARYLENTSQMFQRLIGYLPSIAMVCPVLIPARMDLGTIKVKYQDAANYMSLLNLPHNLLQVYRVCFREDVFYGLEYETKDAYFIKQLDPDRCRISGVEYGSYVFQFDMSFFDNTKNTDVDIELLDEYEQYIPGFFTKAYNAYKKDSNLKWVELPAENTICIKLKEELDYCYPPFASAYKEIRDIEDYKSLGKVAEEQANYKLIGFKIPRLENRQNDRTDNFAVKLSTAQLFFDLTRESVDDNIGMFYSPMDFESISFASNQSNTRNKVKEATDQLYDSLGFSKLLFNSDSATTLQYSTKLDESQIFALNRQLETWVSRKLVYKFKGNFRCAFVDVTQLSINDVADRLLKAATYGLPTVSHYCAVLGINQNDMMALNYLQTDVLDISNNFIPLSSSNTMSAKTQEENKGGRPKTDTPTDSTVRNQNAGTNEESQASKL